MASEIRTVAAMVEHLRRLGQIRLRPAAFHTSAGLIVHPAIMRLIRERTAQRVDRILEAGHR